MEKLKQCPYCNGTTDIKKRSINFVRGNILNFYVECTGCGASTEKYDTYFAYIINGQRFPPMTEKEAINQAVCNWNNRIFDTKTRLMHMSNEEKVLWYIEHLLGVAWYGENVSIDSLQWKTALELRGIAEDKGILILQSDIDYDLGEVAKALYKDAYVLGLVTSYLSEYE